MKRSPWLPLLIGAAGLAGVLPAWAAEPPAKPVASPAGTGNKAAAATPAPLASPVKSGAATPSQEDLKTAGLALKSAQAGKLDEALKMSEQVHQRQGNSAFYYELQGTILTLAKQYGKAEASFQEFLKLEPESHIARFNRAETILLQKRFAEAEAEFAKVEEDRQHAGDAAVADLAHFKRITCFVAQNQLAAADRLIPAQAEGRQSALYSYARALLSWAHQDGPGALRLIDEAHSLFPVETDALYTDSFVELGWGRRDKEGKFVFSPKSRQP